MSKMSELAIEIEELATEGLSAKEIAKQLGVSKSQVESVLETLDTNDLYEDEVDEYEDDGYALASAGFGTDEDYGSFNSDYY